MKNYYTDEERKKMFKDMNTFEGYQSFKKKDLEFYLKREKGLKIIEVKKPSWWWEKWRKLYQLVKK